MAKFKLGDLVQFQSRQFNTSAGRATYLFDQLTGKVNFVDQDSVEVTADNNRVYRFTLRNNGDFVPQGQGVDPKFRRNSLELLNEEA